MIHHHLKSLFHAKGLKNYIGDAWRLLGLRVGIQEVETGSDGWGTKKHYRKLMASYSIRASMGDVGACWDNAVVERLFGSLKYDWLLKVPQLTREHMKNDVAAYMRYYNLDRLHTANNDMSPITYENSFRKVSGLT